jgi:hypothetical protein
MATVYSNKVIVTVAGATQYDLHVLVENMAGASIVGATVTAGGQTATTNNLGYVDIYLPSGTYTVTASASGYQTASKTINLQGNYSLIIQLQSTITTGNCTFNINTSIASGAGYISPTNATVTSNQSATFTATPYANYQFASWEIVLNGQSNISLVNPLTLTYGDFVAMQPCSNSNTYSVSLKAHFIAKNV